VVGVKGAEVEGIMAVWLVKLVTLFCLENDICPAGIFPRAFSDIPCNCRGTLSSTDEVTEGVREWRTDGED
jgi:hypothetical protein